MTLSSKAIDAISDRYILSTTIPKDKYDEFLQFNERIENRITWKYQVDAMRHGVIEISTGYNAVRKGYLVDDGKRLFIYVEIFNRRTAVPAIKSTIDGFFKLQHSDISKMVIEMPVLTNPLNVGAMSYIWRYDRVTKTIGGMRKIANGDNFDKQMDKARKPGATLSTDVGFRTDILDGTIFRKLGIS